MEDKNNAVGEGEPGNLELFSHLVRIADSVAQTNDRIARNLPVKPLLKSLLSGRRFGSHVTAITLKTFIQHLKQINEIEEIPVHKLLEYLSIVLEGKALDWWIAHKLDVTTLGDLEEGLTEVYLGVDWKGKVRADFLLRTQGDGETMAQYITVLTNMAQCMGVTDVAKEVYNRAAMGLRKEYYDYFRPKKHHSLDLLLEMGRETEISSAMKERYRPPPSKASCWVPDFAAETRTPVPCNPRTRNVHAVMESRPMRNRETRKRCFSCHSDDHLISACPRLRKFRNDVSENF